MATWQFDLHLIPQKKIQDLYGIIPSQIDNNVDEIKESWIGYWPHKNYDNFLNSYLEEVETWSTDIRIWGEEIGNRVDIVLESSQVESIFVRIDVREIDNAFLKVVADFAR